jgi:integrase
LVNRDNWLLVKKYLAYRQDVLLNDPKTVRAGWVALRHLLQWADDKPFKDAHRLRPVFPDYLASSLARNDGQDKSLTPGHMQKVLWYSRNFFEWLREEHPGIYKNTAIGWIKSLQVRRINSEQSRLVRREFWTLAEVEKVISYQSDSLKHMRDKAGLAFLYLSAMRGAAFVTMPIKSVDLPKFKVYQFPEWGVKTKNSKASITFLLPIPSLLEVVSQWDEKVKSATISNRVAWYTRLTHDGMEIQADDLVNNRQASGRRSAFYQGLKELCELSGVEWKSPHKIRHGHGVYGIMHAKTMAEYKALSQNMMHESVQTTDKTYSVLVNEDVGDIISTFKP